MMVSNKNILFDIIECKMKSFEIFSLPIDFEKILRI